MLQETESIATSFAFRDGKRQGIEAGTLAIETTAPGQLSIEQLTLKAQNCPTVKIPEGLNGTAVHFVEGLHSGIQEALNSVVGLAIH